MKKQPELGMAVVFVKHLLWGPDVKIRGIDGGAEYCNELNNDESDSDELSDDDKLNPLLLTRK